MNNCVRHLAIGLAMEVLFLYSGNIGLLLNPRWALEALMQPTFRTSVRL